MSNGEDVTKDNEREKLRELMGEYETRLERILELKDENDRVGAAMALYDEYMNDRRTKALAGHYSGILSSDIPKLEILEDMERNIYRPILEYDAERMIKERGKDDEFNRVQCYMMAMEERFELSWLNKSISWARSEDLERKLRPSYEDLHKRMTI
jgi:hypothetical protein